MSTLLAVVFSYDEHFVPNEFEGGSVPRIRINTGDLWQEWGQVEKMRTSENRRIKLSRIPPNSNKAGKATSAARNLFSTPLAISTISADPFEGQIHHEKEVTSTGPSDYASPSAPRRYASLTAPRRFILKRKR